MGGRLKIYTCIYIVFVDSGLKPSADGSLVIYTCIFIIFAALGVDPGVEALGGG